jgi:hypothetical protein
MAATQQFRGKVECVAAGLPTKYLVINTQSHLASTQCPLSGVKRTNLFALQMSAMSANNPKQTSLTWLGRGRTEYKPIAIQVDHIKVAHPVIVVLWRFHDFCFATN